MAARRLWRVLSAGGGLLTLGEEPVPPDAASLDAEYEAIYRRFGEIVPRAASPTIPIRIGRMFRQVRPRTM